MNKEIVNCILAPLGNDYMQFYEEAVRIMHAECYLSEFELYGNYVMRNFPELYRTKKITSERHGVAGRPYAVSEIESLMSRMRDRPVDVFTMHSWDI